MTELFILGLLQQQPMSGYDIQQALESSQVELWGGILVGSIYHALHKLEKKDCVVIVETKSIGKRKTNIYDITETGEKRLLSLIVDNMENNENIYPSNSFAALTFSNLLSSDECITALYKQIQKLDEKSLLIHKGQIEKEKVYMNEIARETFIYMQKSNELHRQYLENITEIIKKESENYDK